MASFGCRVSCGCGSKSVPQSGSGIASVPVLTAGEHCILAASGVVGGGNDDKVSDLAFSYVARWLTVGSCSPMQGSPSSLTLVFSWAIPSSSSTYG